MNRYNAVDMLFTPDGDFALDPNGDFLTVEGNDLINQTIMIALGTTNPDWFNEEIGADLEDLIGLENTRETAEMGKEKIKTALKNTEFFEEDDIWIEATPTSANLITFIVFINSPFTEGAIAYEVNLDLGFGATVRRAL